MVVDKLRLFISLLWHYRHKTMWIFNHVALKFLYLIWCAHANSFRRWTADSCVLFGWGTKPRSISTYVIKKGQKVVALQNFQSLSKNIHTHCSFFDHAFLFCIKELPFWCCGLSSSKLCGQICLSWALLCWHCEVSCPWIHGRLNINQSAFVLSHLHLLHSVRS